METVESCLSVLELDTVPDADTLKKSFRRVMLAVHPDRNPENRSWAEARTREVLQAYQYLIGQVDSSVEIESEVRSSPAGTEKYQIIVAGEVRMAMPLRWLKAVVRFEETIQKRGFHGSMIVHNNRMYPLFSHRGRSATARPGQAIALFEWQGGRAAMVLFRTLDHFYALDLDYREVVWSRRSDGTVRIFNNGQTLIFPAFLIPVMEEESRLASGAESD